MMLLTYFSVCFNFCVILHSMRAQSISYEVSFSFLLISLVMMIMSFNMYLFSALQKEAPLLMVVPVLAGMWLISSMAETNRAPFDFAEGESELVSGFNVEYGSVGFALLFIGEYTSMIFMSFMFSVLFFKGLALESSSLIMGLFIMHSFIWVRATLPRTRYDKLMSLFWFIMLPMSLLILVSISSVF